MRNRAAGDSIADTEPSVLARACSRELNRLGIREIGPFPIYSAPLGRAGLLPASGRSAASKRACGELGKLCMHCGACQASDRHQKLTACPAS